MGDKEMVKIRCATAEDYDGIMAIDDNAYEGTDYLPAMYPSFLDTINRVLAVAIINVHSFAVGKLYHRSMFHNPTAAVNLFHVGKQYLTFCKA